MKLADWLPQASADIKTKAHLQDLILGMFPEEAEVLDGVVDKRLNDDDLIAQWYLTLLTPTHLAVVMLEPMGRKGFDSTAYKMQAAKYPIHHLSKVEYIAEVFFGADAGYRTSQYTLTFTVASGLPEILLPPPGGQLQRETKNEYTRFGTTLMKKLQ